MKVVRGIREGFRTAKAEKATRKAAKKNIVVIKYRDAGIIRGAYQDWYELSAERAKNRAKDRAKKMPRRMDDRNDRDRNRNRDRQRRS